MAENTNPTPPTTTVTGGGKTQLTPIQALDILLQAVRLAQGKGAFSLEEASLILEATEVFKQMPKQAPPVTDAPATPAA